MARHIVKAHRAIVSEPIARQDRYIPLSQDVRDHQAPTESQRPVNDGVASPAMSHADGSEADMDITLANNTPASGSPAAGKPAGNDRDDPFRSRVGAPDIPVRVPQYLKTIKRLKWLLGLSLAFDLVVQGLGFRQDQSLADSTGTQDLYGSGSIAAWAIARAVASIALLAYLFLSIRSKWLVAPTFTSRAHIRYVSWTFVLSAMNLACIPLSRIIYIWIGKISPPMAPPMIPKELSIRVILQVLDSILSILAFSAAISIRRGPKLYYPFPDIQTGFGINLKVSKDNGLADLLDPSTKSMNAIDEDHEDLEISTRIQDRHDTCVEPEPNVMDYSNSSLASFFLVGYIYRVIKRTAEVEQLQQEDLPMLPHSFRTENFNLPNKPCFVRREEDAAATTFGIYDPKIHYSIKTLLQVMWGGLGSTLVTLLFWEAVRTILTLSGPFFMFRIISSFQVADRTDRSYAFLCCFLLLFFRFLESVVGIYVWLKENFACHVPIRAKTVALVLSKLLQSKNSSAGEATATDEDDSKSAQSKATLLTMLSVDNKQIGSFAHNLGLGVDSLLAFILGSVFLYALLGNAVLVGTLLIPVTMPLSVWISKIIYTADKAVRKARDRRLNAIREFLASIKLIKLNAYEDPLAERVAKLRDGEVGLHRKRLRLDIVFRFLADQIPLASVAIAFLLYSHFEGKPLEPARAFVAAEILMRVRTAAGWFPPLYQWFLQANISAQRICDFLNSPDMVPIESTPDGAIQIRDATIAWPFGGPQATTQAFKLENITLDIPESQLTIITGKSGSGKTLLLEAMLGEAEILGGTVRGPRSHPATVPVQEEAMAPGDFEKDHWLLPGTVAYCSQRAVVAHGTVQSNILFSQPFVPERFWDVLHACNLLPDLDLFPDGALQEIGERGVTLSGGQQARLALARAVYSQASTLLLDDVLAAVDVTCARHIVKHCLQAKIMEGRTIVMVTHSVHMLLPLASLLVTLHSDGQSPKAINPRNQPHEELVHLTTPSASSFKPVDGQLSPSNNTRPKSTRTTSPPATTTRVLIAEEHRSKGGIAGNHYWWLLRSAGPVMYLLAVLLLHVADRVISIWESKILEEWTAHSDDPPASVTRRYAIANVVRVSVTISMRMLIYGMGTRFGFARIGQFIHSALFDRLKAAPLRFFDTVPLGRIVNRFSSDIWTCDSELSEGLSQTLTFFIEFLLSCLVVSYQKPAFALYMILLGLPYVAAANFFSRIRGDTARLKATAESPQVSVYVTLLEDMSTIRAFGGQRWISLAAARFYDAECRADVCWTSSSNFYRVTSSTLANLLVVAISVTLVHTDMSAAEAGFTLIWSARIAAALYNFLGKRQELDKTFIAAERLHEFSHLPPVEEARTDYSPTPPQWPDKGVIEYDNVSGRYDYNTPTILRNLSFGTTSGMRLAIVGKTGGGKSSLGLSLFRALQTQGDIRIDGLNVKDVPIKTLWERLALIPQEPVLTSGTLRQALDISGKLQDADIYDSLRAVHLLPPTDQPIEGDSVRFGDLETFVAIGGSNFSLGQRQLLCLARALLKRSRILLMDEATSAIDGPTDTLMQQSLASLTGTTIITIAHRLATIMDYDAVIVISAGEISEYGSPAELLRNPGGHLRKLVDESGETAALEAMVAAERGKQAEA